MRSGSDMEQSRDVEDSEAKSKHAYTPSQTELAISSPTTTASVKLTSTRQKSAAKQTSPFFDFPREIRDFIYARLFAGTGDAFVSLLLNEDIPYIDYRLRKPSPAIISRAQAGDYLERSKDARGPGYSAALEVLLTCRQFYEEAYPIACRQTAFYLERVMGELPAIRRLKPPQFENIRHIVLWSQPPGCEGLWKQIPPKMKLDRITILCRRLRKRIPCFELRVSWLRKMMSEVPSVKEWEYLTGKRQGVPHGGISMSASREKLEDEKDSEYAEQLRGTFVGFDSQEDGSDGTGVRVIEGFDEETNVARVMLPGREGGRDRVVKLKISRIFEVES